MAESLLPRALCALEDVTKRVPGYNPGQDPEIDETLVDLILQESRDFLETTGRELRAMISDTDRTFDVYEQVVERRRIWIGDAATVTGVALRQHDGSLIQTLEASAWVAEPRVRDDWEPITRLVFPYWTSSPAPLYCDTVCVVTGAWGFPMLPDSVRRAVATFVIIRYLSDVAAEGTPFADLAARPEFNLAGSLRVALDVRDRLRLFP